MPLRSHQSPQGILGCPPMQCSEGSHRARLGQEQAPIQRAAGVGWGRVFPSAIGPQEGPEAGLWGATLTGLWAFSIPRRADSHRLSNYVPAGHPRGEDPAVPRCQDFAAGKGRHGEWGLPKQDLGRAGVWELEEVEAAGDGGGEQAF